MRLCPVACQMFDPLFPRACCVSAAVLACCLASVPLRIGALRVSVKSGQPDETSLEGTHEAVSEWIWVGADRSCANPANEWKELPNSEIEECKEAVLNDLECGTQAVTSGSRCYCLTLGTFCRFEHASGFNVYEFYERACPDSDGIEGFRLSHHGSWNSRTQDVGRMHNAEECGRVCRERIDCVGFSFSSTARDGNDCWLHTSLGEQIAGEGHAYTKCTSEVPACDTVSEGKFALDSDETEIIYVRHGLSLNNVFLDRSSPNSLWRAFVNFQSSAQMVVGLDADDKDWKADSESRFKAGYAVVCHQENLCGADERNVNSSLSWEVSRYSRDCLLHPFGEASAFGLQNMFNQLLPASVDISGFYASPLRRTIETMFATFSGLITRNPSASVGLALWAHEKYKSESDHAYPGDITSNFTSRYIKHLGNASDAVRAAARSIERYAQGLGDWTQGYGHKYPPSLAVPMVDSRSSDSPLMRFYPRRTIFGLEIPGLPLEPDADFEERMTVLRRWMKLLPPGRRYVLVSHGGIARGLFGRSVQNLGVVVGRFRPTADAESPDQFFETVTLGREEYNCSALPGWRE